jgi:hypothetical protein
MTLVVHDPLDGFALGELHGLSDCRGEVDVILLAGLALDDLNFCWKAHNGN